MTIDISNLIAAAGGEVVGKVRLQKIVYLLHHMGCDTGFDFDYHHYGPYSEALAEAVTDCVRSEQISAKAGHRVSDGVPYIIYSSSSSPGEMEVLKEPLAKMQARTATVLELAATAHWLAFEEKVADWKNELIARKGIKTQNGRVDEAIDLLNALGIAPK